MSQVRESNSRGSLTAPGYGDAEFNSLKKSNASERVNQLQKNKTAVIGIS